VDREPGSLFVAVAEQHEHFLGGLRPAFFCRAQEPEDLPDLEAERAFANSVIVDGLNRDPERAREVIAQVTRSFVESGRYSAEEVRAPVNELLGRIGSARPAAN
jgi:hypothetical protein